MGTENSVSALDICNLDVSYPGREVLKSVSLTVAPGEFCALIGPNGAGKTTLLRAILGVIPSRSTHITSMGVPLQPRSVGYVPQRHEFAWDFPISIRQAVLSARARRIGWGRRAKIDDHRAVEEALHQVGLAQLGDRVIGELSGGQRQRVLVARALALRPQLLLLDEPFTGLDMPTQESLMDVFRRLALSGCAILMTTHDSLGAIDACDRLFLLNSTVVASGTPEEIRDPQVWMRTFDIRPSNPLLKVLGVI
ncbi:MAG: anchored repeat-type ABC transporter ATP-binding subunit [Actinomyces sp.]|nr:anchored repeat-type ABC transporter ATP-binding subunit [Actinomyces sp.]